MFPIGRVLTAVGLGVAGMYFFDPQLGKTRRAKLRDQFNSKLNRTRRDAEAKLRDLSNRAYGTYHEISTSIVGKEERGSSKSEGRTEEPAARS